MKYVKADDVKELLLGLDSLPWEEQVDEIVDGLETVELTERPKGRWIVENEESIRCSECCYNRARIKYPLNFCPECGADMREEKENER